MQYVRPKVPFQSRRRCDYHTVRTNEVTIETATPLKANRKPEKIPPNETQYENYNPQNVSAKSTLW